MHGIPASEPQGFDILPALRRQWYVPLATAILGAIVALGLVMFFKGSYESTATVQVLPLTSETASSGTGRDRVNIENEATIARSTEILEALATRMDVLAPSAKKASRAEAAAVGDFLYLSFSDADPVRAAKGAATYAEEYLDKREQEALRRVDEIRTQLNSQIAERTAELDAASDQIAELRAKPESTANRLELETAGQRKELAFRQLGEYQSALVALQESVDVGVVRIAPKVPTKRTGMSPQLTLIGGALAGALAGLFLALMRDRRDDRYSIVDQANVEIRELAKVDAAPASVLRRATHDSRARQQHLRLLLRLEALADPENKYGDAVLIVPVESRTLPSAAARNLIEALAAEAELNGRQACVYRTARTDVDFDTDRWKHHGTAIRQLRVQKDLVLVEVDALSESSDALALAHLADVVLLAISESTTNADIRAAQHELEALGARVGGIVTVGRAPHRGHTSKRQA